MSKKVVSKSVHKKKPFDDTEIFKYHNGTRMVGIDPLDIHLAFSTMDYDWEAAHAKIKSGHMDSLKELIVKCRYVFNLDEYEVLDDGSTVGCGAKHVVNVLTEFGTFMDALKKNIDDLPTSAESMDPVVSQDVTTSVS